MKLFRKLLALLVATALLIGILPIVAFASSDEDDPIVLDKTYDPATGCLNLSAYATGSTIITTEEKSLPCDIVLVLDVSGSMDDDVTIGTGYVPYESGFSYSGIANTNYYYKDGDGYYLVKGIANQRNIFYKYRTWLYYEKDGTRYYLKGTQAIQARNTANPTFDGRNGSYPYDLDGNKITPVENGILTTRETVWTGTLYRQGTQTESKLKALKTAVTNFIESVEADAISNHVEHQISIVKFAGGYRGSESSLTEGNHFNSDGNNTEVVKNLLSVTAEADNGRDGADVLIAALDELEAEGATYADYGMTKAGYVLASSNPKVRADSKKIVVLFTDGEPNHGSGFSSSVANTTINKSLTLKTAGTTVYTVGIYDDPSESMTNYMNAVSSNYPYATGYATAAERGEQTGTTYYKHATNSGELYDIFDTIAKESVEGGASISLSSETILRDVISKYFSLPQGVSASNITVHSETYGGNDTWSSNHDEGQYGVQISTDGKTVEVTGFDYSKYYVDRSRVDRNANGEYGRRIVVSIPVDFDTAAAIADGYVINDPRCRIPTNEDSSGVYDDLDNDPTTPPEAVDYFPVPTVELDAFKVVHCGATTDAALHTTEYYAVCDDFDFTRVNSDNTLYGGTFTDAACTEPIENPMHFAPQAGQTYYIWEVSPDYLNPKTLSIWKHCEDYSRIDVIDLYFLTAIDRLQYAETGFTVTNSDTERVYSSMDNEDTSAAYGSILLNDRAYTYYDLLGKCEGALTAAVRVSNFKESYPVNQNFRVVPYWITLDGVKVTGTVSRQCVYLGEGAASETKYQSVNTAAEETVASTKTQTVVRKAPMLLMQQYNMALAPEIPATDGPELIAQETVSVHDNGAVYEITLHEGTASMKANGAVGKRFAGWYLDEACTQAANLEALSDGMSLYAKYCSDSYLDTAYSMNRMTKTLTVLSAVEDSSYVSAGFRIEINGECKEIPADGYSSTYLLRNARSWFGTEAAQKAPLMVSTVSLKGLSKNSRLVVTPYGITADGTTVYGTTRTLTYTGSGIRE